MDSSDMRSLAEFIAEHCGDNPDRLALQKEKWPGIDVAAAASTIVSRRKLAGKAPLWATAEGLVLPRTLSAEQCSGQAAARHKAAVAARIARRRIARCHRDVAGCVAEENGCGKTRPRIADLTGGLGVDTLEFSRVAEAVLYNEMLPELAAAAEHNFHVLGAENIEVCGIEASPETLGRAGSLRRRLEEFRPDVIYLDPARRDGCGRKVFLLEDCSPDILKIKDMLLELAPVLMLKLSPMADISMLLERLGGGCRELHVVESGGECKELTVLMRRDGDGDCDRDGDRKTDAESATEAISAGKNDDCLIRVYNLDTVDCGRGGNGDDDGNDGRNNGKDEGRDDAAPVFEFLRSEASRSFVADSPGISELRLAEPEEIVPGALLFEPCKALMKAGCFSLIGERLGAPALGRDTHYYILPSSDRILTSSDRDAPGRMSQSDRRSQSHGSGTPRSPEGNHAGTPSSLNPSAAGKLFRILDIEEMSGKGVRDFAARHPEAEVTARNVRMTSEELRRRLRCKSSDRLHIFALHADRPGRNLLLFTERT